VLKRRFQIGGEFDQQLPTVHDLKVKDRAEAGARRVKKPLASSIPQGSDSKPTTEAIIFAATSGLHEMFDGIYHCEDQIITVPQLML
jgi:hypothetical protein